LRARGRGDRAQCEVSGPVGQAPPYAHASGSAVAPAQADLPSPSDVAHNVAERFDQRGRIGSDACAHPAKVSAAPHLGWWRRGMVSAGSRRRPVRSWR